MVSPGAVPDPGAGMAGQAPGGVNGGERKGMLRTWLAL